MTAKPDCGRCAPERLDVPFTMAFQPIVDLVARRIDAHEALVRGPAGEPAAAVLQRIDAERIYAFDQACRVRAIEQAAALGLRGQLNINFLPRAVYEPEACLRRTLDAAARTGFPPDRLTFEFTEQEQVIEPGKLRAIIATYRRHGFRIALDDFGVGYSGLARLADLRPDIIKLDRVLVQDCDRDPLRRAIVESLVSLTAQTGIKLVAEGIERVAEARTLRQAGVRYLQGFLFARPVLEGIATEADIAWPDLPPAG